MHLGFTWYHFKVTTLVIDKKNIKNSLIIFYVDKKLNNLLESIL